MSVDKLVELLTSWGYTGISSKLDPYPMVQIEIADDIERHTDALWVRLLDGGVPMGRGDTARTVYGSYEPVQGSRRVTVVGVSDEDLE